MEGKPPEEEKKKFFISTDYLTRKFKKVRMQKKLVKSNKSKQFFFREIAFQAVLNFFLVQKLIIGPF